MRPRASHAVSLLTTYSCPKRKSASRRLALDRFVNRQESSCRFFAAGLELFGLIVRDQRVDQVADVAFHKGVELVHGVAYAVVRDAIVFKIVGANLLGA